MSVFVVVVVFVVVASLVCFSFTYVGCDELLIMHNFCLCCFFVCCCYPVCPAEKRKYFQSQMLKFMTTKRDEAGHVEPSPEAETTRDPRSEPRLSTPAKQTIYWMFDELDVSPNDRRLSTSELSGFTEEVKRSVGPRACADTLVSYCDYNRDGFISLGEWCWCNGLDNSKCD